MEFYLMSMKIESILKIKISNRPVMPKRLIKMQSYQVAYQQ